jgi:acetyl-CoA synthetase
MNRRSNNLQSQKARAPALQRDEYRSLFDSFRWSVPTKINLANECCLRWAGQPGRIAILHETRDVHGVMSKRAMTFTELRNDAARLAHALKRAGVSRGDVVAIILPQRPEVAACHMALYALGAIAMPLSVLFGPDALEYRLNHGDARAALLDNACLRKVEAIRSRCPMLKTLIGIDLVDTFGEMGSWQQIQSTPAVKLEIADTRASDPALLIYTSGTTGNPKGALIPHCAIFGNLSGFVASQNWFPLGAPMTSIEAREGDVFWSPADWAWTGGLWDALLPTLYFGMPIVAADAKRDSKFSAEEAFRIMEKFGVTNTFLFPTALKSMMKSVPHPRGRFKLRLRAIMSAGEPVGSAVFDYCRDALGVSVNEMFGQTEVNYIVGNSDRWPARAGSMGRPYPGHDVAIIDDDGAACAPGEVGEVAINRFWHRDGHAQPDPIFFNGYWKNESATREKYTGNWCRTGDLAYADADGYLWYQGRSDDMFKSSGYRIGPAEIENCLVQHPAVANVAVIGKPDHDRTHIVKAFVVLSSGHAGCDALVQELQAHVRSRLAAYETPREIEFIDQLPMTTTGKVQRRVLREQERQHLMSERDVHGLQSASSGVDQAASSASVKPAAMRDA